MYKYLSRMLDRWKRLIGIEWNTDEQQHSDFIAKSSIDQLCAAGVCLKNLKLVGDARTHQKQKLTVLTFAPRHRNILHRLPDHELFSGDPVSVSRLHDFRKSLVDGKVKSITEDGLEVAFHLESAEKLLALPNDQPLVLLQAFNPTTYLRLIKAIDAMREPYKCFGERLIAYLFHEQSMTFPTEPTNTPDFYDVKLNESQQRTVERCVDIRRPVNVIHGPPGTGKTQTLIEIIAQCVYNNEEKLLVCAPSNVAVDNVMERLLAAHPEILTLRLGNPERFSPNLLPYTLQTEFQDRNYIKNSMNNTQVIFATLVGSGNSFLMSLLDFGFDVCIIDECAQAMEVACWIALIQARRCVLAGDHNQLPPTVKSQQSSDYCLSFSLMERLSEDFDYIQQDLFTMLSVQYRMNAHIMRWSSDTFYNSKLTAHSSVERHLLSDFKYVHALPNAQRKFRTLDSPLALIDTGRKCRERNDLDHSHANHGEVRLVFLYLRLLIQQGVKPADVAIISPYRKQVQLLNHNVGFIYPEVSIRSVDAFQGQEREVVLMSLVRSNEKGHVGFLSDSRRLNVAITRARRHVCVIASVGTVSSDRCIRSLMQYIRQNERAVYYKHHELLELDGGVPFRVGQAELFGRKPTANEDVSNGGINVNQGNGDHENERQVLDYGQGAASVVSDRLQWPVLSGDNSQDGNAENIKPEKAVLLPVPLPGLSKKSTKAEQQSRPELQLCSRKSSSADSKP